MTDTKGGRRVHEEELDVKSQTANGLQESVNNTQVNGDITASRVSLEKPSVGMENVSDQLPPEIEHIGEGYISLTNIVTRLVQDTFNGLTECINDMSGLPVLQREEDSTASATQINLEKKQRMLVFAQERRAQFIKVLVLSQWSRQAEAVSKVIDLKQWLELRRRLYDGACNWLGELARIMEMERMPNPDLKTALEVLSLGEIPGLPDLGYLPPQPLSPQQLLNVLRGINTQLSLRLHLHDTIPPGFKNHSVADGRATFRVPDEFEVDLSIADDDFSTQLYFIDFRFTFSPMLAELSEGQLRGELEHRVNEVLSHDGLRGCYRFLHDFVLSHKINILRHQAYRLSQETWSEHLKVEAVHRSLVIQYWVGRPGGRNWIEVGVRRRKSRRSSWLHREEDEPHIGIRWFRAGKEILDVPVAFNHQDLSIEVTLKQIISAHTDMIFKETIARLRQSQLYSKNILRLKSRQSVAEPAKSRLYVQLTATQSCKIIQETTTGRLTLLPASSLNSRAERELNGIMSLEEDSWSRIAQLRAITACDEVENVAKCHGWEVLRSLRLNQESLRLQFGNDTLKASFFRKGSWNTQWLLAFTASLAGDLWWIVELNDRTSTTTSTAAQGPSIRAVFRVPVNGAGTVCKALSALALTQIECSVAGLISQFTDSRQLSIQNFPHRLVRHMPKPLQSELPTLYVQFPDPHAQKFQKSPEPSTIPWKSQTVRISFIGVELSKSLAKHFVVAQRSSATLYSQMLESVTGESVKFHPKSGAFAFCVTTPVGQSTIPAVLDRLARVQRILDYITTLQAFKLEGQNLSLDHLEFTYAAESENCRVNISFTSCITPQFSLNVGNPHLRIQDQLNTLFRQTNGLDRIIRFLQLSLPLMRAFAAIETAHTTDTVTVLPRSADWYQVRYQDPPGRFDLRLRRRRENLMWFVQPLNLERGEKQDERIHDQLGSVIKGRGKGWVGVNPGIAATLGGIEVLVKRIDDIFLQLPPAEPAPTGENQDFKGQKRKADDSDVVVLE
ncbi:MAG: hypothetical protein L6R41_006977 [Letrouitia leprolyta]|nr:MAG: hypothetical protein L6R41_006977 [Letrouitia leprolyta]